MAELSMEIGGGATHTIIENELYFLAEICKATITYPPLRIMFPNDFQALLQQYIEEQERKNAVKMIKRALMTLLKAFFAIGLLISISIIGIALLIILILILSQNNRGGGGGAGGFGFLDLLFRDLLFFSLYDNNIRYSRVNYRPMPHYDPDPEPPRRRDNRDSDDSDEEASKVSFIEEIFYFLFGNKNYERNNHKAECMKEIGLVIYNKKNGIIKANEICYYLDDYIFFKHKKGKISKKHKFEHYIYPVLRYYNGKPDATDEGEIFYRFPDLIPSETLISLQDPSLVNRSIMVTPPPILEKPIKFYAPTRAILLCFWNIFQLILYGWFLYSDFSDVLFATYQESYILIKFFYFTKYIYFYLVLYGAFFIIVPFIRFLIIKLKNLRIRKRNKIREEVCKETLQVV